MEDEVGEGEAVEAVGAAGVEGGATESGGAVDGVEDGGGEVGGDDEGVGLEEVGFGGRGVEGEGDDFYARVELAKGGGGDFDALDGGGRAVSFEIDGCFNTVFWVWRSSGDEQQEDLRRETAGLGFSCNSLSIEKV